MKYVNIWLEQNGTKMFLYSGYVEDEVTLGYDVSVQKPIYEEDLEKSPYKSRLIPWR